MTNTAVDESRFPVNRIVAFLGPYISVISGALASWLLAQENVLGLFNLPRDQLAAAIAQGGIFLITTAVTWAGQHKWLTGHQIVLAAAAAPVLDIDLPALPLPAETPPGGDDVHPEPADLAREQAATVQLTEAVRKAEPAPATIDPPPDAGPGGADPPPAGVTDGEPLPSDFEEANALPDNGGDPQARVTPDSPEVLA
jgi:hypothetical protein